MKELKDKIEQLTEGQQLNEGVRNSIALLSQMSTMAKQLDDYFYDENTEFNYNESRELEVRMKELRQSIGVVYNILANAKFDGYE